MTKESYLSVKNWTDLQHYKDRSPPWIKLHSAILDSYEFECLPDASKAHLICIWMLASRTNNKINPDIKWLSRKICANSDIDLSILIDSGFLELNQPLQCVEQDASMMLHTTGQHAIERESREEGEEEKREIIDNKNNANSIFEYWQKIMNHPNSKFTKERKKKVTDRLKTYSIEQIKTAIDGCASSPFHMGQEVGKPQVFDDLTLICRDDTKLEGFISKSSILSANKNNEKDIDAWISGDGSQLIDGGAYNG